MFAPNKSQWFVVAKCGAAYNVLSAALPERAARQRAKNIRNAFAVPANTIDSKFLRTH